MVTTREEIKSWLEHGRGEDITHMIVVCDTFDWDDYPVYVTGKENVREVYSKYNGPNMQKVMEVYSFNHDLEKQLKEVRAYHFD
jgi:hypothetical protein